MDGGHEAFGVGTETARVIAGAAVGAGGYLYFTKTRGWRMVAGALTSFGGGMIGYRSIVSATDIDAGLAAGLACTATLGIIFAVRKWAEHLGIAAWIGRKAE